MPAVDASPEFAVLLSERATFQAALLAWYRRSQRELPWRTTPSLYRTVVSEFMLQQTQVKTVLPYFARWMDVFPDFSALANAPESKALKHWEGLGYYSRARNLHRLAKVVAAMREIPRDAAAWRELPGVGAYTSAAIVSIAFGQPEACVDGNVVRILARLTADPLTHRDSASAAKVFFPLASQLLTREVPGDHNQAMMELGATVCHRRAPLCLACPVRTWCVAGRSGTAEDFPRLMAKTIERVSVTRVWARRNGSLLLHRAAAGARRFAGMHELPTPEHLGLSEASVARGEPLARRKRGITRYAITESIYLFSEAPVSLKNPELVWIPMSELEQVTLSGPHRRWVAELLRGERTEPKRMPVS